MAEGRRWWSGGPLPRRTKLGVCLRTLWGVLVYVLCVGAVLCHAEVTTTDAVASVDANIVASLPSPAVSGTVNTFLPIYDRRTNTSVKGVYCVDGVNGVLYVGSNVIHVYMIKQSNETGIGTTDFDDAVPDVDENPTLSYFFEHAAILPLDGWATGCVFASQYELYLPTVSTPGDDNNTTDQRRFYTVIHRYLRLVIRTSAVPPRTQGTAPPAANSSSSPPLRVGSPVVQRRGGDAGVTLRVITPLSAGFLSIDDFQIVRQTTQHVVLDSLTRPLALKLPAFEQPRGKTDLYALTFTARRAADGVAAASSLSSSTKNLTSTAASVDNDESGHVDWTNAAWDIVGITLPDVNKNETAVPETTATVTECFARCYAAVIHEACADCVPVAFATSRRGIVVTFTSAAKSATYVTLLPSGTACTTGTTSADAASHSPSAGTIALANSDFSVPAPFNPALDEEKLHFLPSGFAAEHGFADSVGGGQLLQIAATVCNVSAVVVDDFAASRVYVAMGCPTDTPTFRRRNLRLASVELSSHTANATSTVVHHVALNVADGDHGTEEVITLELMVVTRLLHLSVRRGDGSTQVYTYAAFGVTQTVPRAVDMLGGTMVVVKGFGLVLGMSCVFGGSGDAVVEAIITDATSVSCSAPPLTDELCSSHPVSIRMTYDISWAIPSPFPRRTVVSPINANLHYLLNPVVEQVVNAAGAGEPIIENEPATLIVRGYGFVNATKYQTQSTCCCTTLGPGYQTLLYVVAEYINDTAVQCSFHELSSSMYTVAISVSMDGATYSRTSASFMVVSTSLGLKLTIQAPVGDSSSGLDGGVASISDNSLVVRATAHTALPALKVFFVDVHAFNLKRSPSDVALFAYLTYDNYTSSSEKSSTAVPIVPSPSPFIELLGTTTQPFHDTEGAQFADIFLACPPLGVWRFNVYVTNGTHVLTEYRSESLMVDVREGDPYAPVFVGRPSTYYYPDAPLLKQQPVVGVRDTCGNVYTYLNASVFKGPLTVQLFLELVQVNASTREVETLATQAYGPAWQLSTPLNNLFYISNISFPTQIFGARFYINVTAALPQPTAISPRITALPCGSDRQSVLTPGIASASAADTVLLRNIRCGPCPNHSTCNGTANARAEDGYWRASTSSTVFTSCWAVYGMAEACVNDGQCAPGYQGVLCGECAPHYHTLGRACRRCLARGLQGFMFTIVAVVMVLIMAAFVVLLTLLQPSSMLVLSTRSLLLAVQVTSLFMYVSVPWPRQLESLFNGLFATAQLLETMMTCFLSPAGYLIFLAALPLILIPVVALLSGVVVRLLGVHRADAHRLGSVVLMALLHRKQERFYQLRRIIARGMAEQAIASSNRRNTSSNLLETVVPTSYSVSASGTRQSLSTDWAAVERFAATRTARPSVRSPAFTASTPGSATQTDRSTTKAATAPSVMEGFWGMEGIILDAFAAETAAVVERLALNSRTDAAAAEAPTWEQLVVQGLGEANEELLSAARRVRLPLLTRAEVQTWAAHAVEIGTADSHQSRGNRTEESLTSSMKSGGAARSGRGGRGVGGGRHAPWRLSRSADDGTGTLPSNDSVDGKGGAAATAAFGADRPRPATTITWKRVGMIAATREMAVFQFRASWTALFLSSAGVVFVAFYLPLIFNAFLWLQCVTVSAGDASVHAPLHISLMSSTMNCSSAENRAMQRLATAMLVVYGFATPLTIVLVSVLLRWRYGDDVMYAAFPVVFYGDSALDYLVSLGYMLTKLIAVLAVTQTDSPLLQMGVLAMLFALKMFLNSMWSGTGESVVMGTRYLTVTRRSVLTVSRLLFLLVCKVLMLLAYLIVSGYKLSPAEERAFSAVTSCGIGAVFALFGTVSVHQFIAYARYARDYPRILLKRIHDQQQLLETLVRRYMEICKTIELYLKVCDRGLSAAQRLDTLSRFPELGFEETATAVDVSILSFSSANEAGAAQTRSPTPMLNGEERAKSVPHSRTTSARVVHAASWTSVPAAAAAAAAMDGVPCAAPEALTHFSPYPELTSSELLSPKPSAPFAAAIQTWSKAARQQRKTQQRGTDPFLSAAFRVSRNSDARVAGGAVAIATATTVTSSASASSFPHLLLSGDVPGTLQQPLYSLGGPETSGRAGSPVEANAYWVRAPRRAPAASVGASAPDEGAGGTETTATATGAASPVQHGHSSGCARPSSSTMPSAGDSGKGAGELAAAMQKTAADSVAGDKASSPDHGDDATQKAARGVRSGDYVEVQLPTAQPLLKRSDSLLLSIRCLEPEYMSKAQATRTALVEESRALATADYQRELQERQQQLLHLGALAGPTGHSGDITERDAATTKARESAAGSSMAAAVAGRDSGPTSHTAEAAVTIESLVPSVELDLASSFDPFAVPPLPLTLALTRQRSTPTTPSPTLTAEVSGDKRGRGATQALLAGLKNDLEVELRQLQAMPLRGSLLDMDLDQLAAAVALELVDSTPHFSAAGKSRMGHLAVGGGKTATMSDSAAARAASRSFPHLHSDLKAALHPTASSPLRKPGSESPVAKALQPLTTAATCAMCGEETVVHEDDPVTASPSVVPPPLPFFRVPQHRPRASHRTAAEYIRKRSARPARTPRSRSTAQTLSRSRPKEAASSTPHTPREAKGSSHASEKKPKTE